VAVGGASVLVHYLHGLAQQHGVTSRFSAAATAFAKGKAPPMLAGLALVLLMTGCTALNGALKAGSTQASLIRDGVELGTTAVILAQPGASQQTVAANIMKAAGIVQGLVADSSVTVGQLNQQIALALTRSKVPPAAQALINQITQAAVQELAYKLNKGILTANAQTTITTMMSWIMTAATPFAGTLASTARLEGLDQAAELTDAPLILDQRLALASYR
jgi:hypothetical protein